MEESKFKEEIGEDQKNLNKIRCQFCNSLILSKSSSCYKSQTFALPLMHQKHSRSIDELESEEFTEFWEVDDMFTFDNVGFSNTIGNYKFLICADCEMGPVGYHDLETKKSFVALARVKHGDGAVGEVKE